MNENTEIKTIELNKPTITTPTTQTVVDAPAEIKEELKDPKEDRLSSKFAQLSKREKAVFEKEQAAKERIQKAEAYEKIRESAKLNPLDYIKQADISMDDLVKAVLTQDEPADKNEQAERAIKEINDKLSAIELKEQERLSSTQQAEQKAFVSSMMLSINQTIDSNLEKYEAIKEYNRSEDVFQVMFQSFSDSNGEIKLTIEQAAALVEDQLQTEAEEQVKIIQKLRKQKDKLSPKQEDAKQSKEPNKPFKTLTNANTTVYPSADKPLLSKEESLKQAAKLIKWND